MPPKPWTSILKKIIPRKEIKDKAAQWKESGKTVVFTNGCFDILHPGHLYLLAEAKSKGNRLIVAINTDASVARLKGKSRPFNDERTRALNLAALEMVDAVTSFEEDTPLNLIKRVQPHVLVKGGDYFAEEVVGGQEVMNYGGKVEIVTLLEGYSTTRIIEKLNK